MPIHSFLHSILAPQPIAKPQFVADYLTHFRCTREECEDSCCKDWRIAVDQESYTRLEMASKRALGDAAQMEMIELAPEETRNKENFAHMKMAQTGACSFLDGNGLCAIQIRHGEQMLCKSCSIFPRTSLEVGDRLEVGASLACPEIARLVLLSEREIEYCYTRESELPRPYIGKSVDTSNRDDPYSYFFDDVRTTILDLLKLPGYRLATRLVLVADFADRVSAIFYKGTQQFDGIRRAFSERRLAAEIAVSRKKLHSERMSIEFDSFSSGSFAVAGFAAFTLLQRKSLAHSARFANLLRNAFVSYQEEALGRPASATDSVTECQLEKVYESRRALLDARFRSTSEKIFGNYAIHYWLRNPYTDSARLLDHVCKLEIRLALLRFLFLGHPSVANLIHISSQGGLESERIVASAAVEVIQVFSKAIDHHPEFLKVIDTALGAQGPHSFARALCFAKFI